MLGRYRKAREWVWVQEESQNMGGWSFVEPRLRAMGVRRRRTSAATPAPARRPARTTFTNASSALLDEAFTVDRFLRRRRRKERRKPAERDA